MKKLIVYLLLLCILLPSSALWAATGDVLTRRGTPITFKASGGTYVINLDGVTTLLGSWSAQADLGASPQPSVYEWSCNSRMNSAGVLGETVQIYIALGDGTDIAGAPLITSSASSAGAITLTTQLPNLIPIGQTVVDVSNASVSQTTFGQISIPTRYMTLVWFNSSTKTLSSTANSNYCSFTPLYFQVQ